MAASNPAQYAKLGKEEGEQSDAKDIRPGDLNQPVRVPELELQRCVMCCRRTSSRRSTRPGPLASSGVLKTPRAVGLGCCALACCLDVMLRPLEESLG